MAVMASRQTRRALHHSRRRQARRLREPWGGRVGYRVGYALRWLGVPKPVAYLVGVFL